MWPAKTQISLRSRAVWSESSLIAYAFYRLQIIQIGINKNPCHSGWIYRLIWVFAGHTGLIVGFAVHWLICQLSELSKQMRGVRPWILNCTRICIITTSEQSRLNMHIITGSPTILYSCARGWPVVSSGILHHHGTFRCWLHNTLQSRGAATAVINTSRELANLYKMRGTSLLKTLMRLTHLSKLRQNTLAYCPNI